MGLVDEAFQFLRCAEAVRRSVEARDVVAERAVIRMLLYGHYLYGVVAVVGHARQYVLAEFLVGAHALFLLRHAYVAFVDKQRVGLRLEVFYLEFVFAWREPYLCRENQRLFVLHRACGVGRDAFPAASVPMHHQLVEVAVLHRFFRQGDFPRAVADWFQFIFVGFLPAVERAYQIDCCGVRRPFAEHPSGLCLVQSEILVGVGEVNEVAAFANELGFLAHRVFVAALYRFRIRFEPWVVPYDS